MLPLLNLLSKASPCCFAEMLTGVTSMLSNPGVSPALFSLTCQPTLDTAPHSPWLPGPRPPPLRPLCWPLGSALLLRRPRAQPGSTLYLLYPLISTLCLYQTSPEFKFHLCAQDPTLKHPALTPPLNLNPGSQHPICRLTDVSDSMGLLSFSADAGSILQSLRPDT